MNRSALLHLWAIERKPEVRQERLSEYRTVVTEWNDNINRILALVAIHFADNLRNAVDNKIGAEFVSIGHSLLGEIKARRDTLTKKA